MEYRELGKSGIRVNPIGMGCWAYGGGAYWGEQSQKDVEQIVNAALDRGMNMFDTAEMYNDGASEIALGKALGDRRKEAVVCSKISPPYCRPGMITEHCEASLRRLGTDYLDCYMLHWPLHPHSLEHFTNDPKLLTPIDQAAAFAELNKLMEQGKIRSVGVSNFGPKQLKEALEAGAKISINEITYNLVSRAIEAEIVPFCMKENISIVGSMALQQGLLAGIYPNPESVPAHQAHSRHYKVERGGGTSRHHSAGAEEEIFSALAEIRTMADELNLHIAQLSIAWVLQRQGVAATLVGSRNLAELESNQKASQVVLSAEVMQKLDELTMPILQKLGNNPDYYEDGEDSRIF